MILLSVVDSFFMAQTKKQKEEVVKELKVDIKEQKSIVFVNVKGLKADSLFELRSKLKEADCKLQVAKKTLMQIAFKDEGLKIEELEGQIALVFGFQDQLASAKIIHNFAKTNENLGILGGYIEDKFQSREYIVSLAQIPSRKELYAKMVGSISSPISGFMNVLQGSVKGLLYALSAIKK